MPCPPRIMSGFPARGPLSAMPLTGPKKVVDNGAGSGHSPVLLVDPLQTQLMGLDPGMIRKAAARLRLSCGSGRALAACRPRSSPRGKGSLITPRGSRTSSACRDRMAGWWRRWPGLRANRPMSPPICVGYPALPHLRPCISRCGTPQDDTRVDIRNEAVTATAGGAAIVKWLCGAVERGRQAFPTACWQRNRAQGLDHGPWSRSATRRASGLDALCEAMSRIGFHDAMPFDPLLRHNPRAGPFAAKGTCTPPVSG